MLRTHVWSRLVFAFAVASSAALGVAAEKPSRDAAPPVAEVRAAVARSLPYLIADGTKWMRDRACITCHQVPAMLWTLNEAKRRGFDVVADDLQTWNRWAVDNGLKRSVFYKLTEKDLETLRAGGAAVAAEKLMPLKDKNFVFLDDFRAAVAKHVPADADEPSLAAIEKTAAKPNQGGGGGNSQNQSAAVLLCGAAEALHDAAAQQALVAVLVEAQKLDGSWAAAGQYLAQQRNPPESVEVVTRWSVLALDRGADGSSAGEAAVAQAEKFLAAQTAEVVSTEALMLRMLFASRAGDQTRAADLVVQLVDLQHADGGWGWLRDRATSDPFTTAQVLYGLRQLGSDATDPVLTNAVRYLLAAQRDDGVWPLERSVVSASKKEDHADGDYIYTYWTTAWCALGLLSTLPE